MTAMHPPDITWREQFIAEFGLDREPLDESLRLTEQSQPRGIPDSARPASEATTQERIPARYATALPQNESVRQWMAELARTAIKHRRMVVSVTAGPSLLLLGATGRGKTHEGYGVIRGMSLLGIRGRWRFTTAADLYAKLRPRHGVDSEAVFAEHANTALLVVDDLAAGKASEWTEEVNFRLVNWRYEHLLPTLWTSNLTPKPLAAALGERVTSRLAEMTERVTLKGDDRRYGEDPPGDDAR